MLCWMSHSKFARNLCLRNFCTEQVVWVLAIKVVYGWHSFVALPLFWMFDYRLRDGVTVLSLP